MNNELYLFKNKYEIVGYAGEILTKRVGDIITETIKNPSDEQLKEFGYKELVVTERPTEKEGFGIDIYYENATNAIYQKYEYIEL